MDDARLRQAEHEQLAARTRELEAIFRAFPDLLFQIGRDGTILGYRAGRAEDLYARPDEFLGKRMIDVLPPGPGRLLHEAVGRVLAGERLARVDYELSVAGEAKQFEARVVPLDAASVIAVVRDVTEQRKLDLKVQEAQRLESLGVLAGGIAHDFNNLLATILGATELLAREVPASPRIRDPLDLIREAAWRASELSRQLLAYAGRAPLEMQEVDLRALVQGTAQLLEAAISKRARLVHDLGDDVPTVRADVAQLRQVVMNLITNASDSLGGRDGTIGLRVRRVPGDPGRGAAWWAELEVVDDGCGMDDTTQRRMFDPFFSTKGAGRGLGLAAVIGIVQAHAGRIEVDSAPAQGTRVRLRLPASDAPASVPPRSAAPPAHALPAATVLVVDDERGIRETTATILRHAGLTVLTAQDGRDALRVYRERPDVDLVLLDLTMPNVPGDEALAELRRIRADLPVILMTGYDPREGGRGACERASALLHKPFRVDALIAAVRAAFEARARG